MLRRIALFLVIILLPVSAAAEGEYVTRKEGFLRIWDSISRPAFEMRETPFSDVLENDEGYLEITYAKNRGVLEDHNSFYPDEDLSLHDALLWIYRSRNVHTLDKMQVDDLPAMRERYPIWEKDYNPELPVTMKEITAMMQKLDTQLLQEVHEVSYYGKDFHGEGTAFGDTFDMEAFTAAHRSYPDNTLVKVTNVDNGQSVVVRINDRGPYVDGRDMDLSQASFEEISPLSRGVLRATFQRLGHMDLLDDCTDQPRRYYRRVTRDVRFHRGLPHFLTLGESVVLGSTRYFVVRSVLHPDGFFDRRATWVHSDERFTFTPDRAGEYVFRIGTGFGRSREMRMEVMECST